MENIQIHSRWEETVFTGAKNRRCSQQKHLELNMPIEACLVLPKTEAKIPTSAHVVYSNSIKENDLIFFSLHLNYFYSFWVTCEQLSGSLIEQYKVRELLFFMNNRFVPWTVIL